MTDQARGSAAETGQLGSPAPLYARLSRRIQAVMIDNMVIIVGMVIALSVVSSRETEGQSRLVGIAAVVALLLYEPVLVAFAGATLGHRWRNLRVVDDLSGGNISFPRACLRFAIKAVLGLYSFLTMTTTRRYQALHDIATHSTVQVRDVEAADASHFHVTRTDFDAPGMPSVWRRLLVICVFAIVAFTLLGLSLEALIRGLRLISVACLQSDHACSVGEKVVMYAIGLGVVMLAFAIVAMGWRGRLWGARRTS